MPLIKGAKPGSKGFGQNIKSEMTAGRPQKQAIAIAYSEAGEKVPSKKQKKYKPAKDGQSEKRMMDHINGTPWKKYD